MSSQITVRLPEDLGRALNVASKAMQRRNSDVVRLALRQYLGLNHTGGRKPADRVKNLLGALESGIPDLAEKHREYVVESLRNVR